MQPQSHVVRARTIDGYTAENNGRRIVGRLKWFAQPRCFTVTGGTAVDTTMSTTATPVSEASPVTSTEPATTELDTPSTTVPATAAPVTSADPAIITDAMPETSSTTVPVVTASTAPATPAPKLSTEPEASTEPATEPITAEHETAALPRTDPPMDGAALQVVYSGDYAALAAVDDGVRQFGNACMDQLRDMLPPGVAEHSTLIVSAGSVVLEVTFAGVPGGAAAAAGWLPTLVDSIAMDPLSVLLGSLYFQSIQLAFKTAADGGWIRRPVPTTAAPRTTRAPSGAGTGAPGHSGAAGPDPDTTGVTAAIAVVSVALLIGLSVVAFRMRCRKGAFRPSGRYETVHHNPLGDNDARPRVYSDHAAEFFMMQDGQDDSDEYE